ncbi:M48 family metallopeptidase [Candidatus Thioglobus sp.]|nr:M48 family metallopeptidase [Candidatus Thioglobus sp.]
MKIITSMLPDQVIRSNRKTLSISINESAKLIVRAPNRISDQKIQNFINEKENWITRNQSLVKARVEKMGKDKNMLLYLGTLFPLKNDNYAKKISFNGKEFVAGHQNKEKTNKSLKTWYKNKFKEIAVPRLFYFAEKHNLQVNQVRIKEQRTLWGSCSSRNNINLNFLLIMAPLKVIDYVIIHELVHTIHKNHSANFWSAVEEIMPNYKEAKHWLKENGYRLRTL